jgi:uncharacterized protein YjiS (DUF1127 family)
VLAPSNFVPTLNESSLNYASTWQNRDESVNLLQKHDVELIKDAKRVEIEAEIRKQVDELMREELKNLKLVRISRFFCLSPQDWKQCVLTAPIAGY